MINEFESIMQNANGLKIESIREVILMGNREKVLDEIFELALQNDMKYFG